MPTRRMRSALAAVAAVALLIGGGVVASPAFADDPPPLVWGDAPGFPIVTADYTTGFKIAETMSDPFGQGREYLDPLTVWYPEFINTSDEVIVVGLGIDIAVEGEVAHMWEAEAWGVFSEENIHSSFRIEVAPGEPLAFFGDNGVPRWPGHTAAIYVLDETQDPVVVTEVASYEAPGGFVPIRIDEEPVSGFLPPIGQEMTVSGPSSGPELFPGLTATASASGLPAGQAVELWIAPDFDYFFFQLLGATLPSDAQKIGDGVVAPNGTLAATFELPAGLAPGQYQLLAGVRGDDYWPAGTWDSFEVVPLTGLQSETTTVSDGDEYVGLDVGSSVVELGYLGGLPEMEFTATVSATGPSISGFQLAGESSLFYHLSSTAILPGPVELCITYDTAQIPGAPPRLYHFEAAPPGPHVWTDITTTSSPGQVCGITSTFSPFVLGYPTDDGSLVKPAKGTLSSDNGHDTGLQDGAYNIVWDMWWGENARVIRLLENGTVIAEQTLTRGTPNAQHATFPVSGRVNGTYVYTAELVNSRGTTTTSPLTVKVTQANPAKPVLSTSGNVKSGTYSVNANLWWGTNATSYTFVENGATVGSGSLAAATPGAQAATLSVAGKAKGTYLYTVVFANAAGQTSSAVLTVKVTK